jgi:uncharacterized protein YukE
MDFRHPGLRQAALSDPMIKLSVAGERASASSDPITELYKLDCVPSEVRVLAEQVAGPAQVLAEVRDDFDNTRRKLLKKWKGDAADAFARQSLQLLTSYIAEHRSARRTAQAGMDIADDLDRLASDAASAALDTATRVEPACDIVITQTDEGLEEAKEVVREAIAEIQAMVANRLAQIPGIGSRLDDI